MMFVARPLLFAALMATVINVPFVLGAVFGAPIPGVYLAFAMAIGCFLVFVGTIVSVVRLFKWAGE